MVSPREEWGMISSVSVKKEKLQIQSDSDSIIINVNPGLINDGLLIGGVLSFHRILFYGTLPNSHSRKRGLLVQG